MPKSLSNQTIHKAYPDVVAVQQAAQHELVPLLFGEGGTPMSAADGALQVGRAFDAEYERLKAGGLLDYDDLVRRTSAMLANGDAAQWVA